MKIDSAKALSQVTFQNGFHFYTAHGVYTGITATSLAEFASKLAIIDVDSILYNYPRGYFKKWIQNTLGDNELSNSLSLVNPTLSGDDLREQLQTFLL